MKVLNKLDMQSTRIENLAAPAGDNDAARLLDLRKPRIGGVASSATPTPNYDNHDQFDLTALAVGATFAAPSGTPYHGQILIITIKDNGTAQTLAFNPVYRAIGCVLPSTTVAGKIIYLGGEYNGAAEKLDILGVAIET